MKSAGKIPAMRKSSARKCDICGGTAGKRGACAGILPGVEFAHPSCLRSQKESSTFAELYAKVSDPDDRELIDLALRLRGDGVDHHAELAAMLDKVVEVYCRRRARLAGEQNPNARAFFSWALSQGVELRPWQIYAAAEALSQPPGSGKSFLIDLLYRYEREGNG